MSKEFTLTSTAGRLAVHSFSGILLSYIIAFLGTVVVARLLEPVEFGLLSLALFVPSLLMFLGDFGVSSAVTKYVAESRWRGDGLEGVFIYTGLYFDIALGVVLSLVGLSLSSFITQVVFLKPSVVPLVYLASLQAFTLTIYHFVFSALLGMEKAGATGAMMPMYYMVQYGAGPMLFLYGLGTEGFMIGYVIGPLISAVAASLVLWRGVPPTRPSFAVLKKMMKYGGPVSGGSALITLLGQFYNFMIGRVASPAHIGYYSAATRLSFINGLITSPVRSATFPALSKLDISSESESIKKVFHYSVKFLTVLQVPLGIWFALLSTQIILTIFGKAYSEASLYLALYALLWLYAGTGDLMYQALLLGSGKTGYLGKFLLYGFLGGLAIGSVLIPFWGVLGLQVTLLLNQWPSYFFLMRYAKKVCDVALPLSSLLRIYASSLIGSVPVVFIVFMPVHEYIQIFASAFAMLFVYLLALGKFKALTEGDLTVFENSCSGLPHGDRMAHIAVLVVRRFLHSTS